MKNNDRFLISGYILLLFVHGLELRSGYALSLTQIFLGLLAFLPRLNSNFYWNKYILYGVEALYLISLISGAYLNYFSLPNHFFLFMAITLVLILFKDTEHRGYVENNMRWIFIILMGFATLQKLIEPVFLSGDFAGYMLIRGSFFHHILDSGLFPEMMSSIDYNNSVISELDKTDPALGKTMLLNVSNLPLDFLIKAMVVFIIGAELLLTVLFFFVPKKKITSSFLWIFVCSIALVTVELEFQSTLLFVGLILCPETFKVLKKSYKVTFIMFAAFAILNNLRHLL